MSIMLELKEYIADFLDECAGEDDLIFKYLNLIPNTNEWTDWRASDISDEQVHEIIKMAKEGGLLKFLEGWDEISRPGIEEIYLGIAG